MLFVGKDEADQLRKIFSLLGEPDESAWPDYRKLASTRGFRFVTKDKATSGMEDEENNWIHQLGDETVSHSAEATEHGTTKRRLQS